MDDLKILFASDFSPNSRASLIFIKDLDVLYNIDVTLIHVIPSFWKDWFASGQYQQESAQRLMTWQAELPQKNHEKKVIVEYGNPADVILEHAQNQKINLIFLGARATQDGSRYKTGSTIENVARYAKQPVFICKNKTLSKILCGIDCSETSAKALEFAMDLARRFSASLCIASALCYGEFNPLGMSDSDIKKQEEKHTQDEIKKLNEFLKRFDFSGIVVDTHFIPGNAANVMLDRAEDFDHDLIVVGAKGHSLLHHVLIGSTAEKILRYAPCSFLIVR
ncbi:MAG: universal stress protein [Coxiellaceae bacterium]|nr:universal stress protein [Coxiellaceae bacterium]